MRVCLQGIDQVLPCLVGRIRPHREGYIVADQSGDRREIGILRLASADDVVELVSDRGNGERTVIAGLLLEVGKRDIAAATRLVEHSDRGDRKSTRLNSSHYIATRMPSSA